MLGSTQDTNPCGFFDNIWMSDSCLAYRLSQNPNDPMALMVQKGALIGGAEVVGQSVGSALSTGIESIGSGITDSLTPDPLKNSSNLLVGAAIILGIGLVLKKLL